MNGPERAPNLADFSGIVEAYKLAQSFEQNMGAIYGKDDVLDGKITDLFFVRTGKGLQFLKKYSEKGLWLQYKYKKRDWTGLDVKANIESAAKLFDKVFNEMSSLQSEAELDRIAEQLGVQPKRTEKVTWKLGEDGRPVKDENGKFIRVVEPGKELSRGEVLRQSLTKVVEHLNQLKYRVGTSWAEQAITVEELQIGQQLAKANDLVGKIFATATAEDLLKVDAFCREKGKGDPSQVLSKALLDLKKSLTTKDETKIAKAKEKGETPRLLEITSHRLEMNKVLFKEIFKSLESSDENRLMEVLKTTNDKDFSAEVISRRLQLHELVDELKKIVDDVERLEALHTRSDLHQRIKALKETKISAVPQKVQTTFLEAIPEELKPSIKLREKHVQQHIQEVSLPDKAERMTIPEARGKSMLTSAAATLQIPHSEPKTLAEQELLRELDRLNRPFDEQIYNALILLVKADPHSETYLYACDIFFKKLGSLNAAEKLPASPEVMEPFRQLSNTIATLIDPNSIDTSQAKLYGMVLFANHSVELLFRRWGQENGFTANFLPSITSTEVHEKIKTLQTADPFWIDRFKEMMDCHKNLLPGQQENVDTLFPIKLSSGKDEKIELNSQVVRVMADWTRKGSATAQKITESIKADRKTQEESIQKKEADARQKAIEFEKAYNTYSKEAEELDREIRGITERLQALVDPRQVIYNTFASIEPLGTKLSSSWNRFESQLKQKIASLNVQNFDEKAKAEIQELIISYCPPEKPNDLPVQYVTKEICDIIERELAEDPRYQAEKSALEKKQSEQTKARDIAKQNAEQADRNMRSWAYISVRGARADVRTDSQYWPWGIDEGDARDLATSVNYTMQSGKMLTWTADQMKGKWVAVPDRWSEKQLAEYYFSSPQFVTKTKAIGDIVPREFREIYCNSVIAMKNLFYKQGAGVIPPLTITRDSLSANEKVHTQGPGCITLKAAAVKGFAEVVNRPDLYLKSLESKHSDLYKNSLKALRVYEELAIPKWVTAGIAKPVEEVVDHEQGIVENVLGAVAGGFWNFAGWAKEKVVGSSEQDVLLDDELRELTQLSSDDAIRIDNTIAYFEENPKVLRTKDGCLLFHALIFKDDLLSRALLDPQANELLLPRLKTLFSRTIAGASNSKDYASAADVCWLAATLQQSINHLNTLGKGKTTLKDVIDNQQVFGLIQACADSKYTQERENLYESLVAACGLLLNGRAVAGQEELIAYGLIANLMKNLQEKVEERKTVNLPRAQDAQQATILMRDMLSKMEGQQKFAAELTQVSRKVLGTIHDSLAHVTFKDGNKGVFLSTDKGTWLSLTEGRLENSGVFQRQPDVLDRDTESILIKSGLYTKDTLRPLRGYTADGIVHITDKKTGLELKVDKENRAIFVRINAKQNGVDHFVWANFLTEKLAIANQELRQVLHQLRDDKGKVYFCDKETFSPRFESMDSRIVKSGDSRVLSVCPQGFPLGHFEDPDVSRYWCNEGSELQLIELPRFKLTFQKNKSGRWEHEAGWCLAHDQSIAGLNQKSDGYLVLEKGDKKKVFFSAKDPISGEKTGQYLEYTVDPDTGKLVPLTTESRYYLASFYFKKGKIEEVEKLLNVRIAEETSRKLTTNEEAQLRSLFMSADQSPRGYRLRMQALYLLERNKGQFVKEVLREEERKPFVESEILSEIQFVKDGIQFVGSYLKQGGHVEPENELFVLRRLQKHAGELAFEARRSFPQGIPKQIASGIKEIQNATHFENRIEEVEKAIRVKQAAAKEIEEKRKEGLYDSEAVVPLLERAPSEQLVHYLKFFEKVGEDAGRSLALLRRQYFDETPELLKITEFPDLFSLKSPQATSSRAKEKYSQTTNDIAVAQRQEINVIATSPDDIVTPGTALYATFAEASPKLKVVVKEGKEEALKASITSQLEKEEKLLAQEGQLITAVVKASFNADPLTKTLLDMNMRSYPTIEELSLLCCRKDYISFAAKHYPELGASGMDFLQVAVKKYLVQKSHVQHLHRTLNDVEAVIGIQDKMKEGKEIAGLPEELEALQEKLRTTIDSKRAYPSEHKLAMIFLFLETTLDITLRTEQVMNILKFDESMPEGGKKGHAKVLQMIMGAGKTSVIQPILSILFARLDSLSTIMVPEAQYQAVRKLLSKTLGDTYDKCLYSVPYDLELSHNGEYLDELLINLEEAKKRGACLLLPPRVKYSIVTSLYSAYYDSVHASQTDMNAAEVRVDRIAKICKFMEENELLQIDEYDMIMNPNVVFTSPIGESDRYDEKTGYARPAIITELMFHLIEMGEKIREEVSIDFVNVMVTAPGKEIKKAHPGVPDLDARLYRTKIKPLLVDKTCELLAKRGENFKKLDQEGYLKPFLLGELPDVKDQVAYETRMKKRISELVITPEDQDFLVACWESINEVLSSSLQKKVGEHYGSDMETVKYIARPYEALKQKPTVYSEPLEKIAHSIALYMNKGIPLKDAKEILLSWQEKIKKEMVDLGKDAAETEFGARLMKVLSTIPEAATKELFLDEESPTYNHEFEALAVLFQRAISRDKATFVEFTKEKIYTNVTVNLKSATCTPQTLAGSGKKAFGYAGTYNKGLLAPFMEGLPEVGTDAKTILASERKILNGTANAFVCLGEEKVLPERILEQFRSGITVVIDTGSWLKQKKIEDFVKDDLFGKTSIRTDRPEIEGVVYINDKGEKVCWDDVEKRTLPFELSRLYLCPEKRLTIIPSAYVTGTDITQTPNARAFMTISVQIPPITLRDALQSIFRMRQILGGQSVSFGTTEEAKRHISNSIVDGLLHLETFKIFFDSAAELAEDLFAELLIGLQKEGIELEKPIDLKKILQDALASYNGDEGVKSGLLSKEERIVVFQSCFAKLFNPESKAFSHFIWGYFGVNQASLEAQQESEGAVHVMKELTQKPLRSLLTNTFAPIEQRIHLFATTEGLFIQTESKSEKFQKLLALPGQKRDEGVEQAARHLEYLMQIKNSTLYHQVSRFIVENYGTNEEKSKGITAEKILEARLAEYAEKISSFASEGRIREVEAEKEKERTQERLVEKEKEKVRTEEVEVALTHSPPPKDVEKYPYKPLYGMSMPGSDAGYDINKLIDAMLSSNNAIANVLPEDMRIPELKNIYYSENLIRENKALTEQKQATQHLPARYVLCCGDGKSKRYVLLSHADYALVKKGLSRTENLGNKTAVVYTLNGSVVAKPRGAKLQESQQDEEVRRRTLVTAKFCMARRGFDPMEIETLMDVITSGGGLKLGAACRKYYKDRLKYLPKTSREFYKGRGNELAQRLAGLAISR